MHNCKSTRHNLTDLALNEIQPSQKEHLLAQLKECAMCREEYASIRESLGISKQALLSTLPSESFWAGYHDRLVNRLENQVPLVQTLESSRMTRFWLGLRNLATASVRVPVAAAVLFLVFGIGLFGVGTLFAWNARSAANQDPLNQPPAVITQTVTVPVTTEKLVTRIVYVDRNRSRTRGGRGESAGPALRNTSGDVAQASGENQDTTAISLIGFKPTDQVKLKILKGSYRDEH